MTNLASDEPTRYYWDTNVGNGALDRVEAAVGHGVAGIVDELAGGIIAYAHPEHARLIVGALNTQPKP